MRGSVTLCVVAVLVAACSSPREPSSAFDDDAKLVARVQQVQDSVRVATGESIVPQSVLEQTHDRLKRACMREAGLDVPPASAALAAASGSSSAYREPTALDRWLARGRSFGLAEHLADPRVLQELRTSESDLPPDDRWSEPELAVLYGSPPERMTIPLPGEFGGSVTFPVGGCFGTATQRLYGVSPIDYERAYQNVRGLSDLVDSVVAAEGVTRLLDSYGDCMQQRDLDVGSPADIPRLFQPWVEGIVEGSRSPQDFAVVERAAWAADFECKKASGLGSAFAVAFAEVVGNAVRENEGAIAAYREMLAHAATVVGTT